jgi:hypothetical protein
MKPVSNQSETKDRRRLQKGVAAVELAIILPLLVILLLVEDLIKSRIIAYLANENITVSNGAIVVNQAFPLNVGGLTITGSQITITYTRPLLTPGVTSLIPLGSRQLRGAAVFRNFYD